MNNQNKTYKLTLIILIFFQIFSLQTKHAFCEQIQVNQDNNNKLIITENTDTRLTISNFLSTFNLEEVENNEYSLINIPGYAYSTIMGNPKLPVKKELIELPFDAEIEINILSCEIKEYQISELGFLNQIIPVQPPRPKDSTFQSKIIINGEAYLQNSFSPSEIVSVEILGVLRGKRLARLNISPIQYNPVLNSIKVYEKIEIEIEFKNPNFVKTKQLNYLNQTPYFKKINTLFLNSKKLKNSDTVRNSPIKFVILSDSIFKDQLKPFIEWKTKKGFKIIEAYTNQEEVGNTNESIKLYLQSLYDSGTPDDPPPTFLLIVGDVGLIPSFEGTTGNLFHKTDLYYCEYTGDYLPELFYGRFSANNTQELQAQIDKTIEYEQFLFPDPSFLNKAVLVAGVDFEHSQIYGNGQVNYETSYYLNPEHNIEAFTYLYPESGSNSAEIKQNISDGVGFVNYTGHGSSDGWEAPSFKTSDTSELENDGKYPLIISNACTTSDFKNECFGEALLRAENKGAVGYIGASNVTHWDPDFYWSVGVGEISEFPIYENTGLGMYDRAFHDKGEVYSDWYVSQGQMIFGGNLAVSQSGIYDEYYWEVYNLLGDPSLSIYFSNPEPLVAIFDSLMPLGTQQFTVITEPYAYIGISKDGVLHGAATANSYGEAIVSLTPINSCGYVDIVITKQNFQAFIDSIIINSPEPPYVILNNYSINDEAGNNNGIIDFGETISLNIEIKNYGNTVANKVSVSLLSSDEYITIIDGSNDFGMIQPQDSTLILNSFSFVVDELINDRHLVIFNLEINDTLNNSWNSVFALVLYAPQLTAGNLIIDDQLTGNGNGILEPGESASIFIITANIGHSDAANTIGIISTESENLSINESQFYFNLIEPDVSVQGIFNVSLNAKTPKGSIVELNYDVTSGDYTFTESFVLKAGLIFEDFESGDFSTIDWVNNPDGSTSPWFITNENPKSGEFCARSGVIEKMQTSALIIGFNVLINDSISFFCKTSSELDHDFLEFYIDENLIDNFSGEKNWKRFSYPVSMGEHAFKWIYDKDYSKNSGEDCAWIDNILFPPVSKLLFIETLTNPEKEDIICYPNPCSNQISITYKLPKYTPVTISIYNSSCVKIATIIDNEDKNFGRYTLTYKTAMLKSGVYFCVFNTKNQQIVKKMVVL